MTASRWVSWLAPGESATVEFKKSTAEKERACRTLCAFANGQGGRVLFGVTPAGKAVGQTVSGRTLEEVKKAGYEVGVVWQDGRPFHGAHHIRMNLALPMEKVVIAMDRLKEYVFI